MAAVAGMVLSALAARLMPFVSDDAFISLRYAERFADGNGLTWNDGERVEGYSNLLWVLLTAGLVDLGVPGLLALRLLGAAGAAAALAVLAHAGRGAFWPSLGAVALLAATAPMAPWTIGGLEGPLVVLLVAIGLLALTHGCEWRAGAAFALLCLTRPEFPLWVAALAAAQLLLALPSGLRAGLAAAMRFSALPLLAVAGQTALRLLLYGEWTANTARIKATITMAGVEHGLGYVGGGLLACAPLLLGAVFGTITLLRQHHRRLAVLLALPALTHLLFLALVGGDHFLGWRLLLPVLPPLTLLALAGLQHRCRTATVAGRSLCIALPIAAAVVSLLDQSTQGARTERFEWQGKVIGEALQASFGDRRPLLAVDGAGALPYYSRLPAVDMLGLNDAVIARTPVAPPRYGYRPGHMHANGAYVLARQPDIVQYGGPPGLQFPLFESDLQLEAEAGFLRDYRCVAIELPEPLSDPKQPMRCLLWLRLQGRIGIDVLPDEVRVPGWLLHGLRQQAPLGVSDPSQVPLDDPRVATLLQILQWQRSPHIVVPTAARLQLELRDRSPTLLADLPLPAGRWRIVAEADGPLDCSLRDARGPLPRQGDAFAWTGGTLDLTVAATDAARLPLRVAQVVMQRQRD